MSKGSRVKLSAEAKANGIHRQIPKNRLGTITGESHDGFCWNVCWDGNKTPGSIHKDFCEIVKE